MKRKLITDFSGFSVSSKLPFVYLFKLSALSVASNVRSLSMMSLTLILLTWNKGELVIILADGRWDLTWRLKG